LSSTVQILSTPIVSAETREIEVLIGAKATVLDLNRVQVQVTIVVVTILDIVEPETRANAVILSPHTNTDVGPTLALLVLISRLLNVALSRGPQAGLGAGPEPVPSGHLVILDVVIRNGPVNINSRLLAFLKNVGAIRADNKVGFVHY